MMHTFKSNNIAHFTLHLYTAILPATSSPNSLNEILFLFIMKKSLFLNTQLSKYFHLKNIHHHVGLSLSAFTLSRAISGNNR